MPTETKTFTIDQDVIDELVAAEPGEKLAELLLSHCDDGNFDPSHEDDSHPLQDLIWRKMDEDWGRWVVHDIDLINAEKDEALAGTIDVVFFASRHEQCKDVSVIADQREASLFWRVDPEGMVLKVWIDYFERNPVDDI